MPHFILSQNKLIYAAVCALTTDIANHWSDEAITAVASIVEALVEVTSLPYIEYLII